jgi:hypothetical protein
MSLPLLQQKLPEVIAWIERTLARHAAHARPVASLGFPRLNGYYSAALLTSAHVIPVANVPAPPLSSMGLTGFDEFEFLEAAGITYFSSFFVRHDSQHDESLHFHELVHVVQWQHLGPERFILAYALGHLVSGGYTTNPLEKMAYGLQARFDHREPPFDAECLIRSELDRVVPELLNRAGL